MIALNLLSAKTNRRTPLARMLVGSMLVLGIASTGWAQDAPETFEELLGMVEKTASEIKAWSADMEMEMAMMGMEIKTSGKMTASGGRMFTQMTTNTMGQDMKIRTILGEDGIQWTEVNVMGRPQVMKVDVKTITGGASTATGGGPGQPGGMGQNPRDMLRQYNEMYEMSITGSDTLDEIEVFLLEGKLKEGMEKAIDPTGAMANMGMTMDAIRIAIGKKDSFVRKMEMISSEGKPFMTMLFKNVKLNIDVDESLFTYTPPEGVQVMDMTAMVQGAAMAASDEEDSTASDVEEDSDSK